MPDQPLVSVVIPAYNAALYLGQALASVLSQEYEPLEVIVVDDGSSDNTAEIARSQGGTVQVVSTAHQGVSEARNAGFAAAQGELIALLDADDYWLTGKLERQVALMSARPDVVVTYCAVWIGDESGELRPAYPGSHRDADVTEALLVRPAAITASQSCVMVRRAAIERAGPYDQSLTAAEDLDYLLRLSLTARFCAIDEPLVVCRSTAMSASRDLDNVERSTFRVLRAFFARPEAGRCVHLRRRSYGSFAIVASGMRYQAGDLRRALGWGLRAVMWDPRNTVRVIGLPIRGLRRLPGRLCRLVHGGP